MTGGVNLHLIVGNLGDDPEYQELPGGRQLCTFAVATNEHFKTRDGTHRDWVEWHHVSVWGRQANTCRQQLRKGSLVFVRGAVRTRQWQEQGEAQVRKEIVAEWVTFLGSRGTETIAGDATS